MSPDTLDLLLQVIGRLERHVHDRDCPAVVAMVGSRRLIMTDFDYLRSEQTASDFETRAAARARAIDAARWVFAVPQVWTFSTGKGAARAVSNHPLRPGEEEAITWMSVDHSEGVDYGLVPFQRRLDGSPVFGEPETFTAEIHPAEAMPGYMMLRQVLDTPDTPSES